MMSSTTTTTPRRRKHASIISAGNDNNNNNDNKNHPKTIYLIRHGHSQGQEAKKKGIDRKRDPSLIDCGLSKRGIQQAMEIPSHFVVAAASSSSAEEEEEEEVELVISSPLTRALQTSCLGFPHHATKILVHYGLREIGSSLPENFPRGDIDKVIQYIHKKHNNLNPNVDGTTLKPPGWPEQQQQQQQDGRGHNNNNKTSRIHDIFYWIAQERNEQTIAVVCHYGVISAALAGYGDEIRPRNAIPIPCHLYSDGTLVPIQQQQQQQR